MRSLRDQHMYLAFKSQTLIEKVDSLLPGEECLALRMGLSPEGGSYTRPYIGKLKLAI